MVSRPRVNIGRQHRSRKLLKKSPAENCKAMFVVAKMEKKFGARGYEIYTKRRVWPYDGSPAMEGMRVVLDYMREAKMLSSSAARKSTWI